MNDIAWRRDEESPEPPGRSDVLGWLFDQDEDKAALYRLNPYFQRAIDSMLDAVVPAMVEGFAVMAEQQQREDVARAQAAALYPRGPIQVPVFEVSEPDLETQWSFDQETGQWRGSKP